MKKLDLKREACLNQENLERYVETVVFLNDNVKTWGNVLDIGPQNPIGIKLSNLFNFKYNYTVGDLNYLGWMDTNYNNCVYDTVLCFEVIEHLMNPLLFLEELKRYLHKGSKIFISYPFHYLSRHWGEHHFHEMDERRFYHLVDEAGYKITKKERVFYCNKFSRAFRGIRPIFRYLSFWWVIKNARRFYIILEKK